MSRHVQNYRRQKNIFPESFIAFLPTISIKAKDFAAEMTNVNVQQKNLYGEGQIATEHVDNNKAVQKMMIDRGIVPENLPLPKMSRRSKGGWLVKRKRLWKTRITKARPKRNNHPLYIQASSQTVSST